MRAYSVDLRERVVRAVRERGQTPAEAARAFEVSVWTVKRYPARAEAGTLAPAPLPGRTRKIGPGDEAALRAQWRAAADARLAGHCDTWAEGHGVRVSRATMGRALRRLGWSRKERASSPPSATRPRAGWRASVAPLAPADLVFVDECGTHIALTPLYAWAPRGERAYGAVPRNRGQDLSLVAALTLAGCEAAMTLDGAVATLAFEAYMRAVLVPTLRPGQVVILDNLSVHKSTAVRALVEGAGCALLSLPPYSPDLNPIELAFSKLKALLRRAGARTREALAEAIGTALAALTPAVALSWFAHCGHEPPDDTSNLSAH